MLADHPAHRRRTRRRRRRADRPRRASSTASPTSPPRQDPPRARSAYHPPPPSYPSSTSPTATSKIADSTESRWSSTMTPAVCCGPNTATTTPPCTGSSTRSVPNGALGCAWCRLTALALDRSRGRAGGGRPGRRHRPTGGGHGGRGTSAQLKRYRHACGRTPTSSPHANTPSWPGSPRPTPTTPRLPCSKKACATCSPSRGRRQRGPRQVDLLGPALPDTLVRQTRPTHTSPPRRDPRRARTRPVQRLDRKRQHKDPSDHPHGLRLPRPQRPGRHGPTQPRRAPTHTARPARPRPTDT